MLMCPRGLFHVHQSFLKSEGTVRRLGLIQDQVQRSSQQIPPQQLSELGTWLEEQQEEVGTFRTHCQSRLEQMESLLGDLNRYQNMLLGHTLIHHGESSGVVMFCFWFSLQRQHENLDEWLQNHEKQSVVPGDLSVLLKELQDKR